MIVWPSVAQAGSIFWGSQGYLRNTDSRGHVWSDQFWMECGVFLEGFTPTFENRNEWLAHWVKLGQARFDSEESRFAGVIDTAQFSQNHGGRRAYFWAKNGEDITRGPEWFLITRADWVFPAASASSTPAITWTTNPTTDPILGALGPQMVTSRVRPQPICFEDWLVACFPGDLEKQCGLVDPDGDGMNNQLEYFLGSDPADPSSIVTPTLATDASGTRLSLGLNPYAESTCELETSSDLKIWTPAAPQTITDRPDLIEVWVPKSPPAKAAFFRFELNPANP